MARMQRNCATLPIASFSWRATYETPMVRALICERARVVDCATLNVIDHFAVFERPRGLLAWSSLGSPHGVVDSGPHGRLPMKSIAKDELGLLVRVGVVCSPLHT